MSGLPFDFDDDDDAIRSETTCTGTLCTRRTFKTTCTDGGNAGTSTLTPTLALPHNERDGSNYKSSNKNDDDDFSKDDDSSSCSSSSSSSSISPGLSLPVRVLSSSVASASSVSSALLSPPPPSGPSSYETPIRIRSHSQSSNGNGNSNSNKLQGSQRRLSLSSPVPSLSSTPTGDEHSSSHTGTFSLNNSFSSRGSLGNINGNSNSNSSSSFMERMRNQHHYKTSTNASSGIAGSFHRLAIHDNDHDNNCNTNHSNLPSCNNHPQLNSSTFPATTSINTTASNTTYSHNVHVGNRVVGLGAGLAVGTILRHDPSTNRLSALHEKYQQPKSDKQRPGQRKQRRWNNDKFVGIASEISQCNTDINKGMKIANLYAEAEMEKRKYTMPNFPNHYRTIFGTLATAGNGDYSGGNNNKSHSGGTTGTASQRVHQGIKHLDVDDIKVDGIGAAKVYGLTTEDLIKVRQRFIDGEV